MLLSIFRLASLLEMGWQDVRDAAEFGHCPPPVYAAERARWRRADIETWVAGGCPSREPMTVDEAEQLTEALYRELTASDETQEGTQ